MKGKHEHQPNKHEHAHPSVTQPHPHTTVVVTTPPLGAHPHSFHYHPPYYIYLSNIVHLSHILISIHILMSMRNILIFTNPNKKAPGLMLCCPGLKNKRIF